MGLIRGSKNYTKSVVIDNRVECRRCGFKWVVTNNLRDRKDLLCINCRARKQRIIMYKGLRCEPHDGLVDADLNPIDEQGQLLKPGERICNHRDCMNNAHIVRP